MSPPSDKSGKPTPQEIRRSAADWFVRRREGLSSDAVGRYADWVADDGAHSIALDEAGDAWDVVGQMAASPEMTALRRTALANAARARQRRRFASRRIIGGAIAASFVAACALTAGVLLQARTSHPQVFETKGGERSVITLADRSKVSLDEATRISVSFSRGARDIELLRGQAEFEVAKDASRPFSVTAAKRRVIATGTVFNVDLTARALIVTLVEGHVTVAKSGPHPDARDSVALNPSERLTVSQKDGSVLKTRADTADTLAWRMGKLVFDREPLGQAIDRVNRYAQHRIVLDVASEDDRRVSGVFDMGDARAFAEAVTTQLPLNVRTHDEGDIELVAR